MKNKKGFVFVETIVVVAVLTISLLMVYSTYSAMIQKEKTRIRYNDSVYLYRTYYLSKFFKNFRLDVVKNRLGVRTEMYAGVPNTYYTMLTGFGCTEDIFMNEKDNIGFCNVLLNRWNVSNIYLTYNDLSFLQECTNSLGRCETLVQVNPDTAEYLKTIGGSGDGYRLVVEFTECKDGSSKSHCTEDQYRRYYTTLSLGDLE